MTEKTTAASALQGLRSRILEAWADERIYIDPIIAPGLTDRQVSAIERSSAETKQTGLPHFIAIVSEVPIGSDEGWMRFSSDLAFAIHEDRGAEQTLVLFSQASGGAKTQAYLVDDNGPAIPPESTQLARSASGDFLPVELAVPHQLKILVAAAQGTDAPAALDFDTRDAGDRREDYISATGLNNGNPDALVFGAVAVTALGLSAWLLRRRERYSWKTALTTQPELVRSRALAERSDAVLEPLPEPAEADPEAWDVYDRGRRVQDALTLLVESHPDWAESPDFAHRHAVNTLIVTDRWVRSRLRSRKATQVEPPRFCFLFPHHTKGIEQFVLRQQGTNLTVDLCADCRTEVDAGHEPARLMVPKRAGSSRPVPYYLRDDAYARSGFGSFQPLEDAILEAGGIHRHYSFTRIERERETAMKAQSRTRVEWGIALVVLAVVSVAATMFSVSKFDEAREARIAAEESDEISVDSIYSDRIEGRYDADYDRSRYEAIVDSFAHDPIHIDGYQGFDIDDADLDAIRSELDGLDVPIYVAFLSTSDLDDADGDADILAARIAAELPDDRATVLVIGNTVEGIGDKGAVRRLDERPATDIDGGASAEALAYVHALTAAEVVPPEDAYSRSLDRDGTPIVVAEERTSDPRDLRYGYGSTATGIVFGLIVGGGVGAAGMLIWRRVKRGESTS